MDDLEKMNLDGALSDDELEGAAGGFARLSGAKYSVGTVVEFLADGVRKAFGAITDVQPLLTGGRVTYIYQIGGVYVQESDIIGVKNNAAGELS